MSATEGVMFIKLLKLYLFNYKMTTLTVGLKELDFANYLTACEPAVSVSSIAYIIR